VGYGVNPMVRQDEYPDVIYFRSHLDFTKPSWLFEDQHFYTGLYEKPENIHYDIKWSAKSGYSFVSDSGEVKITSTSWSQPFYLEIERKAFKDSFSDNSLAIGLHKFITHLIDCIEHIYLEIGVICFHLDGRPILFKDSTLSEWRLLQYTKQTIDFAEVFEEYSLIDESGRHDVVCGEAAELRGLELSWRFLIDSIANFETGRFRSCVTNAWTAVEVEISPVVRDWLSQNTFTGANEYLNRAMIELGNPLKLEIFFKSAKTNAISTISKPKQAKLLSQLKWLNTTRNHVVHDGQDINPDEAKKAIQVAGLLLRLLWVHKRYQFFKEEGIDLSDFIFKDLTS
jgi:hypothetical protein